MPRSAKSGGSPDGEPIEQYEHTDKMRLNNPSVGLVTVASDAAAAPKQYS
jgi:hypothetical protein